MKLFQRTLWSFVGVIGLQAALAGAALSTIFGSMQAEDADREMSVVASDAYDAFNAWKLAFWKDINELAEDRRLVAAVARSRVSPAEDDDVARELALRQASTAIGATVARDNSLGFSRYVYVEPGAPELPEASSFYYKKLHPYVEIAFSKDSLWFVGAVRIAPRESKALDVFIVKKIDADLVGQLTYDPMAAIAVSVADGGPTVAARYSGGVSAAKSGGRALEFALDLLGRRRGIPGASAYESYPAEDWRGGSYSAVVQQTGAVVAAGGEKPVLLTAVLSLAEYSSRADRLQRSVLAVSLVVVALTIVVALVLSRSIVWPIRRLSSAMRRIEGGDFRAEVRGPVSGELGELLEGFNGMARKLAADKLELEEYIGEIVGLKERSDGIIESIREGLAVIDGEGRVESANASFRALFGEAAGTPGARIVGIERGPFDEALLEDARRAIRDNANQGDITRRAADGRSFEIKLYPLAAAIRPAAARCILVVEDTSERLAYEERAIQADRLASIGMLSAGIAHEINNPLASILANVGNAIAESSDADAVASLRVVERETMRIARIVQQLLDFSSPRQGGSRVDEARPRCDANAVVKELVRLVGYPLRGEGRVEFLELLDPDCPLVAIAEDELKQVLLNLLKNALHAVGRRGRIRAETRATRVGVEISVGDDGPGIPDDILRRIFDPFFTTKAGEGGTGLGLGLSVVYGIVTKRGGTIRAVNEPGGGVLFAVDLPMAGGGEAK